MRVVWLIALALAACDSGLVGEGGECTTSDECAAGLLCDFSKTPHVCAKNGSLTTDLATPPDFRAVVDLAGADFAGADFAGADFAMAPPDLSAAVDMAAPDDLSVPLPDLLKLPDLVSTD